MVRRQISVLFLWLATIMCPYAALAAQGDITIAFGNLCPQIVLPVASGPPYYLFSPGGFFDCASGGTTYFRITDKVPYNPGTPNADRAQIVPASVGINTDSTNDTLRFYNFKIFAVTPTPSTMPLGYQITFWREHTIQNSTDGPGSSLQDRWYKSSATGAMKKTLNNWIKLAPAYVTHPVGSPEKTLGTPKTYTVTAVTCPGATCGVTLSTSGKWPETSDPSTWLTGNRMLRVHLSFKFQNGNANPTDANSDWILLNTGAKINDQTSADSGDQEECSEQYTECPSCWDTIFSTTKWTKARFGKVETSTTATAKLDTFTRLNWASLQQDMARGSGEYLTSLASLLEVPTEKQTRFFVFAQDQFRTKAEEGVLNRVEMLSRLQEAIDGRPMLFTGTREPTR